MGGILFTNNLNAEVVATGKGKITFTEGHIAPNCRTVGFKDNESGVTKSFRVSDVDGDDDVNSVALSALMANRDVRIWYDEAITSGCGTQPRINYIRVY
ncbi:hypothetical protein CJF42_23460 [Pseudoalteromonas sp. NBT06-2]|nr:hypothetical protein CJF42_23460 [Pseudoalteromonas sp. NBT06-2]